jgi:hypothetical protein
MGLPVCHAGRRSGAAHGPGVPMSGAPAGGTRSHPTRLLHWRVHRRAPGLALGADPRPSLACADGTCHTSPVGHCEAAARLHWSMRRGEGWDVQPACGFDKMGGWSQTGTGTASTGAADPNPGGLAVRVGAAAVPGRTEAISDAHRGNRAERIGPRLARRGRPVRAGGAHAVRGRSRRRTRPPGTARPGGWTGLAAPRRGGKRRAAGEEVRRTNRPGGRMRQAAPRPRGRVEVAGEDAPGTKCRLRAGLAWAARPGRPTEPGVGRPGRRPRAVAPRQGRASGVGHHAPRRGKQDLVGPPGPPRCGVRTRPAVAPHGRRAGSRRPDAARHGGRARAAGGERRTRIRLPGVAR